MTSQKIARSKTCKKCKQEKSIVAFYVHSKMTDGHLTFCKKCVRKRVNIHRAKNIDRVRKYDRDRRHFENLTDEQKVKRFRRAQTWKKKNREKSNLKARLYRRGKIAKAHNITSRRLKKDKPDKCNLCNGKSDLIQGHHNDYNKPDEVIWCCSKCHGKLHRIDKVAE